MRVCVCVSVDDLDVRGVGHVRLCVRVRVNSTYLLALAGVQSETRQPRLDRTAATPTTHAAASLSQCGVSVR